MVSSYSVLMSVYFKENPTYLKEAIDSMLNQTVKPQEILIVKDGPLTKELNDIIDNYINNYPDLFTIVKNDINKGLGIALNDGIKKCRNELIARMDTDDISKKDRCEKQLALFNSDPSLDIVSSYVDEFHGVIDNVISTRRVPIKHKDIYEFAKRRSAFNHPAVMYRKSKVLKNNGYSDMRRNQDVDLFGRMLFNGCKSQNIDESLLYFRCNNDLAKRRKSWENTKSYIATIKKFYLMGYASLADYLIVAIAQMMMFFMPIKVQHWIYKTFLR